MARSFLVPINLNQNEVQNARLQNLASAPASPVAGQIYYDTVLVASYVFNGSAWVSADASKLSGTIPNSALTTNPLARANHTGTQLSATISDLATTVQGYHLNQFAVPTAAVAMGGFQITGLATGQTLTGQAASWDFVVGRNLNTIAGAAATSANVPMAGFTFTGLNTTPNASGQAAEYSWVLGRSLSNFAAPIANLSAGGFKITSLGTPTTTGDAATYDWTLARPLNAFAVPNGNVAMGGFKLTGLSTTPTTAGDSAEYSWVIAQVQSAAAGIASKPPVDAVATTNQTLSGLTAIDGFTPSAGDRILVTGQTTTSANGVYNASAGAWTRTTIDGPAPGEIETGALWMVQNGTVNAGTQWRVATQTTPIVIGTTALSIVQFGAASVYTGSNGILLSGSNFTAVADPVSLGGISVSSSGIKVDATVVARKFSTAIGDGTTTAIVITHNLGTQDVHLQVKQATTPFAVVECDMAATSTTTATLTFAVAPTTGQYRVTAIG